MAPIVTDKTRSKSGAGKSTRSSPQTASHKSRGRTNMACGHCRRRKSKCDGKQPSCNACTAKGRKCVYEPVSELEGLRVKIRKRQDRDRRELAKISSEFDKFGLLGPFSILKLNALWRQLDPRADGLLLTPQGNHASYQREALDQVNKLLDDSNLTDNALGINLGNGDGEDASPTSFTTQTSTQDDILALDSILADFGRSSDAEIYTGWDSSFNTTPSSCTSLFPSPCSTSDPLRALEASPVPALEASTSTCAIQSGSSNWLDLDVLADSERSQSVASNGVDSELLQRPLSLSESPDSFSETSNSVDTPSPVALPGWLGHNEESVFFGMEMELSSPSSSLHAQLPCSVGQSLLSFVCKGDASCSQEQMIEDVGAWPANTLFSSALGSTA